ncbi:MAG: DUF3137 domain-containing protein [Lachnospiraceae bacterium]|nr:DUF3137 domain-containing protein [Lachnospiraceae bacterium]
MPDYSDNKYVEKFRQADDKKKGLIILIVFLLLIFLILSGLIMLIPFLMVVVGIPIYMHQMKLKNQMQENFKANELEAILQDAFPGATYDARGDMIDADGCRECNLFPVTKHYCRTEDGLKMRFGNNNDISMDYVEVYTYEIKTDSDGDDYEATLFKGGLFKYTFFKKFRDSIYIIPNETENGKVKHGLFGGDKPLHNPSKYNKKLHKCELDDVEFNEIFSIYSDNDEDVFYILTPQYMNIMKNLYNKYKNDIRFKFSDNYMYVAVSEMDLFDYDLVYAKGLKVDDVKTHEACVEQTKKELNSLVDFAKTLELGDSIFY